MDRQRKHLATGGLGLRQHVPVSKRLVDGLVVDGKRVMDRCPDPVFLQVLLQGRPVACDADGVLVEHMTPAWCYGRWFHPLEPLAQV